MSPQTDQDPDRFTDAEIQQIRENIRAANEQAMAVRRGRGHRVNPRIIEARKRGLLLGPSDDN